MNAMHKRFAVLGVLAFCAAFTAAFLAVGCTSAVQESQPDTSAVEASTETGESITSTNDMTEMTDAPAAAASKKALLSLDEYAQLYPLQTAGWTKVREDDRSMGGMSQRWHAFCAEMGSDGIPVACGSCHMANYDEFVAEHGEQVIMETDATYDVEWMGCGTCHNEDLESGVHANTVYKDYFISDFDLQHYVRCTANENYFLGAPKIKYLNFNVVAASQMLAGLRSGEIDLVQQTTGSIPVEDYDAVKALDNVTAVAGTPVTNESIFINTANVSDVRVRQALLYGMDRQSMFDALLGGNGELVDGFIVSASPYFSEELGVTAYDPEKAAALIAEAKADGAKTDLVWYVNSSEATFGQAVEYYAAMFEEIGLHIEIRTVSLANLMEVAGNLEHDIMSVEYTYAPVDPYTDVAWLLGGEGSWTGYASDATDEALLLSQELTDVGEITQQYLIVDKAMQEDVAMISGWVLATLGAVSNRLTGVTPNVFGTFVNVQNWDIQ